MRDQQVAKMKRLTIWFSINLVIFVLCYRNYHRQLKHRYLYKMLNVGLCFSRAAAMVINFNLLLVWSPMCKYTLTRLACLMSQLAARERLKLEALRDNGACKHTDYSPSHQSCRIMTKEGSWLERTLEQGRAGKALNKMRCFVMAAKIKSINSFLVAVDHCTCLHTICATTITLASGNLNMAEYRGQNPFQLLLSMPGITGCFMMIILLLMSLSSIHVIRNSSFDLFQIFHRLSIVFVILLILHPSSHILKEQANVDRHNPELCHPFIGFFKEDITNLSTNANNPPTTSRNTNLSQPATRRQTRATQSDTQASISSTQKKGFDVVIRQNMSEFLGRDDQVYRFSKCLDKEPKFVAQSSICWYVLAIGLSCYILDLLFRRLRRSRSSVELIEARTSVQNDLIELVLSNNHKRFNHWLPGQFVYLNCPQIASYEWHPFTISSMDDGAKQFTLHIKSGGDWTRRLKSEIDTRAQRNEQGIWTTSGTNVSHNHLSQNRLLKPPNGLELSKHKRWLLPTTDCLDERTGHPQVKCKRLVRVYGHLDQQKRQQSILDFCEGSRRIVRDESREPETLKLFVDGPFHSPFERLLEQQVSVCIANGVGWTAFSSVFQKIQNDTEGAANSDDSSVHWWSKWGQFRRAANTRLEKQQRSCIEDALQYTRQTATRIASITTSETKLHLMVIVTNIDQLRPFYKIVANYFQRLYYRDKLTLPSSGLETEESHSSRSIGELEADSVREITVFLTRAEGDDESVSLFCREENLKPPNKTDREGPDGSKVIKVNEIFSIHLGRPNISDYLQRFSKVYPNRRKISVYCCGSYHVKRLVEGVCLDLNRPAKKDNKHKLGQHTETRPVYCYHEENF